MAARCGEVSGLDRFGRSRLPRRTRVCRPQPSRSRYERVVEVE